MIFCGALIGAGYSHGGDVTLGYLAACIALFVALYMGAAPGAWHFVWGPDDRWGVMALALLMVCLGGIYTAAWRLRTAGRYLRDND